VTDRMLRMFGRKKPRALKAEGAGAAAGVAAEGREVVSK